MAHSHCLSTRKPPKLTYLSSVYTSYDGTFPPLQQRGSTRRNILNSMLKILLCGTFLGTSKSNTKIAIAVVETHHFDYLFSAVSNKLSVSFISSAITHTYVDLLCWRLFEMVMPYSEMKLLYWQYLYPLMRVQLFSISHQASKLHFLWDHLTLEDSQDSTPLF